MNERVKKLIEENLRTQNPTLDLYFTLLDGSEFKLLSKCIHLEELILSCSSSHIDYNLHLDERTKLKEVPWIQSLTNLRILKLDRNAFRDILFLQHLQNLEELDLSFNYFVDISPLVFLKKLKKLSLTSIQISDVSVLKDLKNLKYLNLGYNKVISISPISHLTELEYLDIKHNNILDISPLKTLRKLRQLNLFASNSKTEDRISDISVLTHLENLEYLDISYNHISTISPLEALKNLEVLKLKANPVVNIDSLKACIHLEEIELSTEFLSFPPIWYLYLKWQGGKLQDYVGLPELPYVEKVWQLICSNNKKNTALARQLAESQGWKHYEFNWYLASKPSTYNEEEEI